MPAPAFGSLGTYLTGSGSSANIPVPAGVAAGDIIIVALYVDGTTTVTGMPAGFAQAVGSPQSATNQAQRLYVMWKRANSADGGTYNFTLSASAFREGAAVRYTGAVASGDPWDATDAAAANFDQAGGATPPVSLTTAGPDRMLVFVATNWAGGGWTPPAGWTERLDSPPEHLVTVDDLVQSSAGSTGDVSTSITVNFSSAAWLGALLPASGEVEPAEGTIDAGIDYDVALTGVRGSAGQVDTAVDYDLDLSGSRESAGQVNLGIGYNLELAGARDAAGTFTPGIGFDINLVGHAPSVSGAEGDLQLGVDYQLQLAGARDALGALSLGLALDIDLVGARPSAGDLQLELGYEAALVGPAAPGGSAHFSPRVSPDAADGSRTAPTATWAYRQTATATGR